MINLLLAAENYVIIHTFSQTSLVMPPPSKTKAQSEAEEFSDVSSDSANSIDSEEEVIEDNWVFPVVGHNAKRHEFQEVSELIS